MYKAIEKNLAAHGMGYQKISDVDLMVMADEDLRRSHYDDKDWRALRRHESCEKWPS